MAMAMAAVVAVELRCYLIFAVSGATMALAEPGYLLISVDLRRRLLILLIFQRATLLASLWAIECLTCWLFLLLLFLFLLL